MLLLNYVWNEVLTQQRYISFSVLYIKPCLIGQWLFSLKFNNIGLCMFPWKLCFLTLRFGSSVLNFPSMLLVGKSWLLDSYFHFLSSCLYYFSIATIKAWPQSGWIKTTIIHSLTGLEIGSLKSGCQQGHFLSKSSRENSIHTSFSLYSMSFKSFALRHWGTKTWVQVLISS